jgi:hypothetical protein
MKTLLASLQYAPAVSSAVQSVEASSSSLPGATKKQLVLAGVTAAAKVGESVPEAHVQLISALIDIAVSILNASGVFNHAPAPAPAQ